MQTRTHTHALAPPHRGRWILLTALLLLASEPRASALQSSTSPTPSPSWDELLETIERMAPAVVEDGLTVGLVIGVLRGDESRIRGYGEVVQGSGQKPDELTVYEIGSVSKVFTGILLADAVTRGLVELQDTVQEHLGDVCDLPTFEEQPIRLWHLSTHTSGLPRMPSNFAPADPEDPYADYSLEAMHAALSKSELHQVPGTTYAYSNLAVALLGQLLAQVQDTDYSSLLRTRITQPLGLEHTSVEWSDWMRAHAAQGYDMDGAPKKAWNLAQFEAAGGIRSDMRDMLRFARASLHPEGGPLEQAMKLSQEIRHRDASGVMLGLGWHAASGGATRWHNGQTGGFHSYLAIWPAGDAAVVLLSNTTAGHLDILADNVLLAMMGHAPREIPYRKPVALERAACEAYVGKYQVGILAQLSITLEQAGLFAQMSFQPKLRIYPGGEDTCFYRAVEAELHFLRDEQGAIDRLEIHQGGAVTKGVRVE